MGDDTKEKAQTRLTFLQNTKAAWVGYYSGLENIAVEFEKAEEEIKKVKKIFNQHLKTWKSDKSSSMKPRTLLIQCGPTSIRISSRKKSRLLVRNYQLSEGSKRRFKRSKLL